MKSKTLSEEIIDIMYDTACNHLEQSLNEDNYSDDVVIYDFPIVLPHKERFYRGDLTSAILAGQYIVNLNEVVEISADEYLDAYSKVNMGGFAPN